LVPLLGIVAARVFTLVAMTTYLPIFLTEEGASLWFAGLSLSIFEAAGVVGALVGGSLSDRLGRRLVLFMAMLTTPLFMLLFLAADNWLRFPLLILTGFTSLAVAPVLMALVQESFPENRAMANGLYMSLSFVIRSFAIVALGAAGDMFGLRLAYAASAVVPLLGLPFLLLLPAGSSSA
jgi:FSR family fosmidomycin resistance protein-like MFS transporter